MKPTFTSLSESSSATCLGSAQNPIVILALDVLGAATLSWLRAIFPKEMIKPVLLSNNAMTLESQFVVPTRLWLRPDKTLNEPFFIEDVQAVQRTIGQAELVLIITSEQHANLAAGLAQISHRCGAYTIVFVQGTDKPNVDCIALLYSHADLVVEAAAKMLGAANPGGQLLGAVHAAQLLISALTVSGLVGFDFADFRALTRQHKHARFSFGHANGPHRALLAVQCSLGNSWLAGIRHIGQPHYFASISGGPDISLSEIADAIAVIQKSTPEESELLVAAYVGKHIKCSLNVALFVMYSEHL